jgi:long-chain acyl-CoA synthetase
MSTCARCTTTWSSVSRGTQRCGGRGCQYFAGVPHRGRPAERSSTWRLRRAAPSGQVPYLGERRVDAKGHAGAYEWMTYAEAGEARTAIGSGLLHFGLGPGATVGLYSVNCRGALQGLRCTAAPCPARCLGPLIAPVLCADWVLMDAACSAYSMVSVPLYDTLGPDAVRYICGHAELAAVACAAALLPTLLPCLADCPSVALVVRGPCRPAALQPRRSLAR